MSDATTVVTIPYESMDPLAIGATDDESKKHRDTLTLEIPTANLVAAVYPDEPAPVGNATEAAREALAAPVDGPDLRRAPRRQGERRGDHRQPVPPHALLEAAAAGVRRDRGGGDHGRPRRLREREGLPHVRGGHGAEARPRRISPAWRRTAGRSARTTRRTRTRTRSWASPRAGTPVWLLNEVASAELKITIGQAQANHWGAGGGGKLILPGVVSDATVESNHCAFVTSPLTHYGAYAGPMRSDIDDVATMCGLDCTMNVILDTHGRVSDCIFGSHPEAHREAIRRFNAIYAYDSWVAEQGQADIVVCGVFAPTDHLFFHTGWGCMSADLVLKDGGTIIYTSPSPGVSTAIGDFPGLALMDLMKPYMPPTAENYQRVLHDIHKREIQMWAGCIWVPIYEVMTRKHLTIVTLEENLEMAADIGSTRRRRSTRRSRRRWSATGRTRRWRCCRSRATSCRATRCGWRRRSRASSRTRGPDDGLRSVSHGDPGLPAGGRRRRRRRTAAGRDPRLDDDPRDPAHVPGRPRGAPDVAHPLALRALRRRGARAADDGSAPAQPRPPRRAGRRSARSRTAAPTTGRSSARRHGVRAEVSASGQSRGCAHRRQQWCVGRASGTTHEPWVGRSLPRVEDDALLRGEGRFLDDLVPVARPFHAAIVRSQLAHARITVDARLRSPRPASSACSPAPRSRRCRGPSRPASTAASRTTRPRSTPSATSASRVAVVVAREPLPRRGRGRARRGRLRPARARARPRRRDGAVHERSFSYGDVDAALAAPSSSCEARFASRGSLHARRVLRASSPTGTRRRDG